MTIIHIIILLGTGVVVGFASGLLGVGGGFILAPVQYFVFIDMGIPPDVAIKLAFGTNLLVILFTSISGTWRHSQKGAVYWKAAIIMGFGGLLFAYAGATLATRLPGEVLRIAFGVIVLLSGISMLTFRTKQLEQEPVTNPWLWFAWAVPLGIITGMVGIGGGVVAVPVLVLALRFKMHHAVGTSLAIIVFKSVGGIIAYIVNGLGVPDLPAYSIGYVNLYFGFLLIISSVAIAQVGAITAHKLPAKQLRFIFSLLMFYIGLKMIGVFDWLGWPI
ncbi:MAG: sulfite exporter TauE/SafE family protein [Dehalococcoidales bacterium]